MVVTARLVLAAAFLAPAAATADPACLPLALFGEGDDAASQFDLGLVDGVPTLCAHASFEVGGVAGCWAVDAKTGALSASSAKALPGHSVRRKSDGKGCIDGYCVPGKPGGDLDMFVVSTGGKRVAILREMTLYVFDAATKKLAKTIPLSDEKAPDHTNVGNGPVEVLYTGDRLYVVGADAGPYIAVWAYKDDGTRVGIVGGKGDEGGSFSVFSGSVNVLDGNRVLLADAGWQHAKIVSADGGTVDVTRPVGKTKPCKAEDLEYLGQTGEPSKGCRKVIAKLFEPYVDLDPVALPDGMYLAALPGAGGLVVLDATKLSQKKRLKLKRCAK